FLMRTLLASLLFISSHGFAEIPLQMGPFAQLEVERLADGGADLTISGKTPHFWSSVVPESFDPEKHTILTFDYFSPSGVSAFSIRYRQADDSMVFAASEPIPLAEAWQPMVFDLSAVEPAMSAPGERSRFHFSLKYKPGDGLQIRNLRLREPTEKELAAVRDREKIAAQKEADASAILSYFEGDFPGKIHEVKVGPEKMKIRGFHQGPVHLRELRAPHPSHQTGMPDGIVRKDLSGEFSIELPRFAAPNQRDRIHSRFRLETGNGEIASHARWGRIEEGVAKALPKLTADHQKGLGGIPTIATQDHEIFELGIQHATVNFVVNALLSDQPRPGNEKIVFEGREYFLNRKFLQQREATVSHLCSEGILVTAILLVGNHGDTALTHPEAEPRGTFAMPNLKTERGADLYRAALHVIANHFSQPKKRIINWVIHNEVDQAGTWTNMGDQPLARYLETYHRSARIVYQTMRARDPHARVFISLTHHWTKRSLGTGTYTVSEMVPLFAKMGRVEGDYEWGVAYHPYPQNLRNPDSWNDQDVLNTFETPYITPKNFEVLPKYLSQEKYLYEGQPRGILFSEQGWNSPTLSIEDQARQLAGMVEFFQRLPDYPVIEAFHLHRYQDMPDREGGLRLGIIDEHGNRKMAWHAYEAIGTEAIKPFEAMAAQVIESTKE
ncbi:MAG: DUF5722 domain-containing protein, partial [Verrucomicrobiota bacterium]